MHSPIAVRDFLSRPFVESGAIDDLPLGEIVRRFVFGAPVVQAARGGLATYNRTISQHAVFNGIFNLGFYLWPLNLTSGDLESLFRPDPENSAALYDAAVRYHQIGALLPCMTLLDGKVEWAPLSAKVELAFKYLGDSFALMMELFRSNRIVKDMDGNPVPAFLLGRPGITIDLESSNLYDAGMRLDTGQLRQNRVGLTPLRSGLWLPRGAMGELSVASGLPQSAAAPKTNSQPPSRDKNSKHDGTKSKDKVRVCSEWLCDEMRKSPQRRPKKKALYLKEAQKNFTGLSARRFDRAWSEAIEKTGANWSDSGRPKSGKNPRT